MPGRARGRKSKDRQYNGEKKEDKSTNNNVKKNTTKILNIEQHKSHEKPWKRMGFWLRQTEHIRGHL